MPNLVGIDPAPNTSQYYYDGEGRRVKREVFGRTRVYVYGPSGQLLAEYNNGPLWKEYVYAGGRLLAMEDQNPVGRSYLTTDHLGSTRLVTNASGNVESRHDYLPFGKEIPVELGGRSSVAGYGAQENIRQRFTGKLLDPETGLQYFLARYCSGRQGRFTTPDEPFVDQGAGSPQSWNLYSYARNNPLRLVDPTGRGCKVVDGKDVDDPDVPGQSCAQAQEPQNVTVTEQAAFSELGGVFYLLQETGPPILVGERGLQDTSGDLLLATALPRIIAAGIKAGSAAALQGEIWSQPPVVRGDLIHQMLGANLPRTFPVIDRFVKGIATSIKSIDLRAATYQNPANLERTLNTAVERLAGFSGGKLGTTVVEGAQISGRVLQVAVPQGTIAPAQQAVLGRVVQQAAQQGVRVVIVPIR